MRAAAATARAGLGRHLADELFSTSYLLLAAAVGTSALGFLFWVVAARTLTTEEFAVTGAVVSAMAFVSGVAAVGLTVVLVRFLPAAGAGSAVLIRRVYAACTAATAPLAVVAAISSPLWSPRLRFLADDAWWTASFAAGSVALAIFALQDGALTGIRQARWIPVENLLYGAFRLVLLALLARGAAAVALAWWLPALAAVAVVSVALARRLVPRHAGSAPGRPAPRANVLRFAAGSWLGSALGLAAVTFTPIIVVGSVGPDDAARFYAAWTLMVGLTLVGVSTSTSLTALAARDLDRLGETARRAAVQAVGLSAAAAAVTIALAPSIMSLFGSGFADGAAALRLLAASVVPFSLSMVGLGVARAREAVGAIVAWESILLATGLPLLALLVSRHGIEGAALAWLVAQAVAAVAAVALCLVPLRTAGSGSSQA